MRIDILTVVPELLVSPLNESILKRAQKKGLVQTVNRYVLEINGKARKEVNFPQALRSVLMNFTLMADVKPEIRFDSMLRMKKWMRTVSDPADKRVLHLVLGGMYLNQCNRVYRGASYTEAQKADEVCVPRGEVQKGRQGGQG